MKIQLTQEDLKRGKRNSCENCPVSLALIRALNPDGRYLVEVYPRYARLERPVAYGRAYVDILLPDNVVDFIKAFDAGEDIKELGELPGFNIQIKVLRQLKDKGFKVPKG